MRGELGDTAWDERVGPPHGPSAAFRLSFCKTESVESPPAQAPCSLYSATHGKFSASSPPPSPSPSPRHPWYLREGWVMVAEPRPQQGLSREGRPCGKGRDWGSPAPGPSACRLELGVLGRVVSWQTVGVCLRHRRPGLNPWVGKIPWRREWHPTPVLLPGKSHGWRSLVGCSPWGR